MCHFNVYFIIIPNVRILSMHAIHQLKFSKVTWVWIGACTLVEFWRSKSYACMYHSRVNLSMCFIEIPNIIYSSMYAISQKSLDCQFKGHLYNKVCYQFKGHLCHLFKHVLHQVKRHLPKHVLYELICHLLERAFTWVCAPSIQRKMCIYPKMCPTSIQKQLIWACVIYPSGYLPKHAFTRVYATSIQSKWHVLLIKLH